MPAAQISANFDFAGPLAYSCSNAQGVVVTVDAVYGVLSGSRLKLFDADAHTSSPLAHPTSVIELAEYAACLAGPAQQGLTWELTLQRKHTISTKPEQESHPRDARRKSTVAGLENKKNWLKSKLRSKSISASASVNSLAALAQDDVPPPMPSTSAAATTSTAAAATSTNTPTRRLSIHTPARFTRGSNNASSSSAVTPNKGSVILSTISRDMQQRWIAAISTAISSSAAAALSPSASSPSSLANLAAYRMPRTQSPSPLMASSTTASEQQSPSFLEVEPPSPRLFTFQENAGESSSKQFDRRSSSPVNPFLPQWLADVRNATNKNGESTTRSFGMRPSRSSNALLSKAGDATAGVSIAISHHEESSDSIGKGRKNVSKPTRPSTASTLSPPALRPQRSSSSLSSSSRLDDSICSTAPSTNPPTPKAFNDSPPNNRQTMCFGDKSVVLPALSKGGWRRGLGFSGSDEEGRTSLGSLTSATSDQSTMTTSTAFETPRRHGSDGDTAPIGSHIIEPAELRRRMMERGVLLDARPSTASGNIGDGRKKSTFGPGARLPAAPLPSTPGEKFIPPHQQHYTRPEGLDVQALFAALPPPKKRSATGQLSGMKTSSSSGSINSLARSRAVVSTLPSTSPSSNSPVHSPLAL